MSGKRKECFRAFLSFLVVLLCALALATPAAEGASFYKGKTIRIVVGYSPGGGFDTFARLLARHLGSQIPGKPKIIVQNMPGAGSLIAANRVYAMQPGDGLTIVTFHYGTVVSALVGASEVRYDPMKYLWLGDPTIGGKPEVLWVRSDLPIRSLGDLKKRKEPLALGATGKSSSSTVMGEFLRSIGFPVKNVLGYKGSARAMAALERKEVDARIMTQATMQTIYRRFIKAGSVRPILSIGTDSRIKPLEGVPTLKDLKLNAEQLKMANFLTTTWSLLRLYAVPPGTAPDRVKILRQAFLKALKSPKLMKDAERQGVIVAPLSAEEVTRTIKELSKSPPEIREKYRKMVGMEN